MKLEFSIERLTENDVISTSAIVKKGAYTGECYKFTKNSLVMNDPDQRFVAATGKTNNGYVNAPTPLNSFFTNAGTQIQANVWYALYSDGQKSYFYECDCSDHPNTDPHPNPAN